MPISSGILTLDSLLGGSGFESGSRVLISGKPGTGKTTLLWQVAGELLSRTRTLDNDQRAYPIVQFCAFDERGARSFKRFIHSYPKAKMPESIRGPNGFQQRMALPGMFFLLGADGRRTLAARAVQQWIPDVILDAGRARCAID